jgi:outer membrane protein assembly factor BamB
MMFTLGDFGDECFLIALERKTGKEIWRKPLGKSGTGTAADGNQARNNSTGPLSTPACDGEKVYAFGQYSDFVAYDMKDGKELWRKNTVKDLGGNIMSGWAYSMSPILDGDKILLPIGGDSGSLAAFDKSGKILWRTDWIKDAAAYTSVVPVEIGGIKQYMLLTGERLVGVSTDGKFLWGTNFPGKTAVCSDPVLCDNVVMASCSYNVGAYFYNVTKEGSNFKAVDFNGAQQKLASHHGGIVVVGDHFYLLTNTQMVCVEAKTGNIVWENRSVGKGSLTYVDGVLILRSEKGDGTIAMIEAAPTGYKELCRFDQPDRSDKNSWTYPVIVEGKMYIRDQNILLCYDLK